MLSRAAHYSWVERTQRTRKDASQAGREQSAFRCRAKAKFCKQTLKCFVKVLYIVRSVRGSHRSVDSIKKNEPLFLRPSSEEDSLTSSNQQRITTSASAYSPSPPSSSNATGKHTSTFKRVLAMGLKQIQVLNSHQWHSDDNECLTSNALTHPSSTTLETVVAAFGTERDHVYFEQALQDRISRDWLLDACTWLNIAAIIENHPLHGMRAPPSLIRELNHWENIERLLRIRQKWYL